MPWWEKLFRVEVLFVLLVFGLPVIAVVTTAVAGVFKHRSDNELKRTMVRQGMSAEDIERVLKARPEKDKPAKPPAAGAGAAAGRQPV